MVAVQEVQGRKQEVGDEAKKACTQRICSWNGDADGCRVQLHHEKRVGATPESSEGAS